MRFGHFGSAGSVEGFSGRKVALTRDLELTRAATIRPQGATAKVVPD
jgi:hypothetical protein